MQESAIGGENECASLAITKLQCDNTAISIFNFLPAICCYSCCFLQLFFDFRSTRWLFNRRTGTRKTQKFCFLHKPFIILRSWILPILLLYLIFMPSATGFKGLEWCEYMKKIGAKVKECESLSSEVDVASKEEDINEPDSYETFSSFETCHGYYGRCKSSSECESGVLCAHKATNQKCCTSPKNQCPSVDQMGYQCRKKNPVNWCNNNRDCGTNMVRSQICCPTGCGYNTCLNNVQNTPPSIKFKELHKHAKKLNRDCPNPFLIPVNCMVPRPVSWCSSVRDCPTYNNYHPRRCCLTPCGYNICLTRLEDKWLIA